MNFDRDCPVTDEAWLAPSVGVSVCMGWRCSEGFKSCDVMRTVCLTNRWK